MPEEATTTAEAPEVSVPAEPPKTFAEASAGAAKALEGIELDTDDGAPEPEPAPAMEETTAPAVEGEPGGATRYDDGSGPPAGEGEAADPEASEMFFLEGQWHAVTPQQRDQLLSALGQKAYVEELQRGGQQPAGNAASAPAAPAQPGAVQPGTADEVRAAIAELRSEREAASKERQEQEIRTTSERIEGAIQKELEGHQVFKDSPELKEQGYDLAMARLLRDPRMSEADAVTKAAQALGKAINKATESYVAAKVKDSQSAEGGAGGATVAPTPRKFSGKDLFSGKLFDAVRAGTKDSDFFT